MKKNDIGVIGMDVRCDTSYLDNNTSTMFIVNHGYIKIESLCEIYLVGNGVFWDTP